MRDEDEDDVERTMDISDTSLQLGKGRRHYLELLKSNGLIFGDEFAHVTKAHSKHRDTIRKQRRLQQQEAQKKAEANIMDFDDDYGGGGFDFGGDDDNDSFGHHDFGNPNNDENNNESIHRSNVDFNFNAIDDVFASAVGGFDENHNNDDDYFANNGQQTFEELCRAHLRKFAKSAEVYAAETQLTRRVGAWQAGLAPLLEEQEKRPEFDIHRCGRQILEKVERNISVRKRTSTGNKKLESSSSSSSQNNVVGFSTIFAKDCEGYEVCRLFLSTLMLCNGGNVAMHNRGGDDNNIESLDSLNIELLNSAFQAPMESFIAPSADNLHEKENLGSPLPMNDSLCVLRTVLRSHETGRVNCIQSGCFHTNVHVIYVIS